MYFSQEEFEYNIMQSYFDYILSKISKRNKL